MKTDASLTDAIIRRIVQGADPVYSAVYIYGEPDNMTAVLENWKKTTGRPIPAAGWCGLPVKSIWSGCVRFC